MTKPTLLMTRAMPASQQFVAGLDPQLMQDVTVLMSPMLDIVPTRNTPASENYSAVIFTSSNGVLYAPPGAGRTAHCVGTRTAEQAKAGGWRVDLVCRDAQELIAALIKRAPLGPFLHIAGAHRRGDIAQTLCAANLPTQVHVAYTQPLLPLTQAAKSALFGEGRVIVPLFSPRVAAHFASQAVCNAQVHILTMSRAVADALGQSCAGRVHIAPDPTGQEMREGVENLLRCDSLP